MAKTHETGTVAINANKFSSGNTKLPLRADKKVKLKVLMIKRIMVGMKQEYVMDKYIFLMEKIEDVEAGICFLV